MGNERTYDKQTILDDLVKILEEMTGDWELDYEGGIGPGTRLIADLGFESIDVVQLIVAIEERFGRHDLPFETFLMKDGRYVDELVVSDTVDFLHGHLG